MAPGDKARELIEAAQARRDARIHICKECGKRFATTQPSAKRCRDCRCYTYVDKP